MSDIAANARSGFANASNYDLYRPSYPEETVQTLLENLKLNGANGARVLEIGAGTGKFTSLLIARPENYEIIAVEPHGSMRETLEEKNFARVKVVEGNAASMDHIENGWADAVICAQAFHWFATMDALKEIHRKLKPGGTLGLVWNIEDYNSKLEWPATTKWEDEMKKVIWTFDDKDPRFRHNQWQKVFDEQLKTTPATIFTANPLFTLPLGENIVKWTTWLTKEAIWDRFHTISHIAVLQGKELEDTKKKIFDAMEGDDVEVNDKGELALHGVTAAYWTSAVPSVPPSSS